MYDLRAPRRADRRACELRRAAITPSEPRKSYIVNRWARETARSESPGSANGEFHTVGYGPALRTGTVRARCGSVFRRHSRLKPGLRTGALSQFDTPDLAADGLGELGEKLNLARVFVGGGHAFAVFLQFALEIGAGRVLPAQHHERLDDLTTHRVGLGHDRRFQHCGVLDQRAFDFEWPDAVAGTLDHVIAAAHKPVVALRVAHGPVASQIPIASKAGRVFVRVPPVFLEQAERPLRLNAHRQFAFLTVGPFIQVIVEQRHGESRGWFAHRSGTDFVATRREITDQHHGFRWPYPS